MLDKGDQAELDRLKAELEQETKTAPPPARLTKAIAAIETAKDAPKLVSLKDFIANASKSNP